MGFEFAFAMCSIYVIVKLSRIAINETNEFKKLKQARDLFESIKEKEAKKPTIKRNYGVNADKHFKNFILWYCSDINSKCLYVENTSLANGIIPDAIIKTKDGSLTIIIEFDEDFNFHSGTKAYKEKWEAYNRSLMGARDSSTKVVLLRVCYGNKKESFDVPMPFVEQCLTEYVPLTMLNAPQNAIFASTYNVGVDVFVKELLDSMVEYESIEDGCIILLRFRKTSNQVKNEYVETKIIHKNSIEPLKTGQEYFPMSKSKRNDNKYLVFNTSTNIIQRSVIRNAFDDLLRRFD